MNCRESKSRGPRVGLLCVAPLLLAALTPLGCAHGSMPRTSDSASEEIVLHSNQNCHYFIDGKPLASGRRVRVLVEDKPHEIICKPDGFIAKKEYVNPPYDDGMEIGFTYMIGEEESGADVRYVTPRPRPAAEPLPSPAAPAAPGQVAVFPNDAALAEHLAGAIATRCRANEIVAVAQFKLDRTGRPVRLSRRLRDALVTALVQRRISVVQRADLDQMFRELKFQHGGAVDPGRAVELGQLLGATALVSGGIADAVDQGLLRISARLTDLTQGLILGAENADMLRGSGTAEMLEEP